MADLIEKFVDNIVNARFEDIPAAEVEAEKRNILDTVGAIIAGSSEEGIPELVKIIKRWGGRREASIAVFGAKVPTHHAALALGSMARNRELDSVHTRSGGNHVSATVIPAAIAIAESTGKVSGKDFITAVAVGEDIICRLGLAHKYPIMIAGRIQGTRILGPAAACSRILGLDREQTINALGIAYSGGLTSLDLQQTVDGGQVSFLHYGFCAEGAVKATLLAANGFTGTRNILQGKFGYFNSIEKDYDLSRVTDDLGRRFEGAYASTKPYPCCKCCHITINAVIDLAKEHDIKPDEVQEIDVALSKADFDFSLLPERYELSNVVGARFSIPYCVAVALFDRRVALENFVPEALKRPGVFDLMKKVKGRVDPAVANYGVESPTTVTITVKNGSRFSKRIAMLRGSPELPMTLEEVAEEKFRWSLPFAVKKLPAKNTEAAIEMLAHLESVDDVTRIFKLLKPQ